MGPTVGLIYVSAGRWNLTRFYKTALTRLNKYKTASIFVTACEAWNRYLERREEFFLRLVVPYERKNPTICHQGPRYAWGLCV